MTGNEARVIAAIDRLLPAARELLQALVRVPSPVGHEAAAQQRVRDRMTAIGLEVDSFDIDPETLSPLPAFNPSPRNYVGRPCLVGTRRGAGGGRSLLLNAHVDTVPVRSLGSSPLRRRD
jgi:acetylornithine deacetylase